MTAAPSIDPAEFLHDQLAQASPDLMRELLTTFVNALLSADADAVCGAAYNSRTPDRVNSRNGYRHRDLDTGSAPWTWRSPSCGPARTSRSGCWSGADAPRRR